MTTLVTDSTFTFILCGVLVLYGVCMAVAIYRRGRGK